MADTFVQVAPDSTGKMMRAISETQGANTVYQQVVVPTSARTRTGYYRTDSGVLSIAAAAQTAPAALLWLINPVGSGVAVSVKTTSITYSASAATAMPTAPRVVGERITFTGTASGASTAVAKRVRTTVAGLTADATNVASVRTANTGLTITTGEICRSWILPAILTAVGTYGGQFMWDPGTEDDELILAAGEGVAFRQDVGGTTTDVRRIVIGLLWEEFTAP